MMRAACAFGTLLLISPVVAQTTNCRALPTGGYECDNGLVARPLPGGGMEYSNGTTARPLPGGGMEFNSQGYRSQPIPGRVCIQDVYGRYTCQ